MQTFVTGGTGLLGNNLVRALREAGHEVRVLVRSREKGEQLLADLGVEFVVGDIADVAGFEAELEGTEVLFHAAAYFREYYAPGDHWDRLVALNVDATVDLLAAAERRGVARVVYISSSGVVGPAPDGAPGDETTLLAPEDTDNDYYRSKILAERAVDEFLATSDLSVVRVLPGWLFGPGDAAPTAGGQLVLNLARGEMPGLFDGGEHVVDARDVTAAMLTAAESGQTGERYVVAGPYVALSELAATVAAIRGVTPPRRLPYPLVAVAARLADTYGRVTGRPVPLTTAAVRTLRTTRRLDAGKATRELGATYRPFEETLRDELDWFEANGYLDETEREAPRRPVPAT